VRDTNQPVYMIGVAAQLCGVHPQTLRQYERLGLVVPARVGAKNRLYSDEDVRTVRRIQRLTQELGVNLAGVEIILRLLEDLDAVRADAEAQLLEYAAEAERRVQQMLTNSNAPIRPEATLLPVPKFVPSRTKGDL
jgi:MerR family transcriptional regulator, heat shock protein HspR